MPKINAARPAAVLAAIVALLSPVQQESHPYQNTVAAALLPIVPPPITQGETVATSARCTDPTNTWLGMRWREPLQWRVNSATIPEYFGDKKVVLDALRSAATTVDSGRNDCGLPADLGVQQKYLGETGKHAGVTETGGCGDQDGIDSVSFGQLTPGLLAVTCIWWVGGKSDGKSVETDILIDSAPGLFFLGETPAGCTGRWDLEGTITHEFGHAFGLGHVSYAQHEELTMSDGLPDCSTAYRGLGLGDYLALRQRYGPN
jgi:hypothetical protein